MSRKRTVRRVWAEINPITHAMFQVSKLTTDEWNRQILPVQVAVDRLSQGDWHKDDCWQPVFECLNRIESMVRLYRLDDGGFIDRAQGAMVSALDREEATGARAFRAPELLAMRDLVSHYGSLLKEVSHAQFSRATTHTNANISRVLREKSKLLQVGGCVFDRKGIAA